MAREHEAQEVLRGYVRQIAHIEVNYGCGDRPCRICMMNAPRYQYSMPLDAISQLHKLRGYANGKRMAHYYRGDPLYWRQGYLTYAAVAEDAVDNGIAFEVRTHGGVLGEDLPEQAIRDLVVLKRRKRVSWDQMQVFLSVDPYGWQGVSPEMHLESVTRTIELMRPLEPAIAIFHNANDLTGPGSWDAAIKFLKELRAIGSGIRSVQIQQIFANGRAQGISPLPPISGYPEPWGGTTVMVDGTILQKDEKEFQIRAVGNMYDLGIARIT